MVLVLKLFECIARGRNSGKSKGEKKRSNFQKKKKIIDDYLLLAMVSNSNVLDDRDCDVDLDSDMLDCCCFSRYPHLVLMLATHDHVPNPVSIYY